MKLASIAILAISFIFTTASPQMKLIDDLEKGKLTILDGQADILTYCFGDQLQEDLDPKHTRSCYIHPLFSLDGQVLTDDFPNDHLHHHGVFWTWPIVKTRGQNTQTWHPHTPSLRQHFVRWLERKIEKDTATLVVENVWKLDGREVVAKETVSLYVHPANDVGRAIDLEIKIQAIGGPLELQGAQDQKKGYGGLCIRGAPMFKGSTLTTDQGLLKEDSTNVPFCWADRFFGRPIDRGMQTGDGQWVQIREKVPAPGQDLRLVAIRWGKTVGELVLSGGEQIVSVDADQDGTGTRAALLDTLGHMEK